jgi:hypothetical protein
LKWKATALYPVTGDIADKQASIVPLRLVRITQDEKIDEPGTRMMGKKIA